MNYERPNEKWICGHAAEGKPCRIGPSRWGHCRATFECQPVKDGSRWRCTRPKSDGGPCANGPLPEGACCRPIPRCSPVRTLRAQRGLVTRWICALTIGGLLVAFYGTGRWRFLEPNPVSMAHASAAFTEAAKTHNRCAPCHEAAQGGPMMWTRAALFAEALPARPEMRRLDHACLECHTGHDFHNAKAPFKFSCAECHLEHTGHARMPAPADDNCAHCHNDAGLMKAAFTDFANHPPFHPPKDENTLKFNHQKHLTGDIPLLNGRKLDCADCHKPDTTGAYLLPIRFEANCQSCHLLQFDVHNPELTIPHGNAAGVRAFLRTLPTQYADLARKKGLPVEEFVTEQMLRLRDQARTGEDLERQVFHRTQKPGYLGCAYCHEVKDIGDVTPPVMPARWFTSGRFDHAKHRLVSCEKCHDVRHSKDTGDVLLPAKAACVSCHSVAGGVSDSCASCHTYHFTAKDFAGTWRTADAHPEK